MGKLVVTILLVFVLFFVSACASEGDTSSFRDYSKPLNAEIEEIVVNNSINETPVVNEEWENLLLSSFYIDDFDMNMADNPVIMATLNDVLTDYDIVAIQGITDDSGRVIDELNSIQGYNTKVGAEIGSERFVFLYSDRITLTDTFSYDEGIFLRHPYISGFSIDNYSFGVVQVSVDRFSAVQEIAQLSDVFEFAEDNLGDVDIFLMGNLFADCVYYDENNLFDYVWLIDSEVDTMISVDDCAYDRIIVKDSKDYIISVGVDNMSDELMGNRDLRDAISNHYPVFVEVEK